MDGVTEAECLGPLLLQVDSADCYYHGMIELHRERHKAYAQKHGYAYRVDAVPEDAQRWFRIEAIYAALKAGYSHVFYLDADSCVADFSADMRGTSPDPTFLGMCIHPYGFGSNRQWHYNTGVIYVRNCPGAKTYFKDVLSYYGRAQWDQEPMNELLLHVDCYQGGHRPLPQKWNQNVNHPASKSPIVAAWHGDGSPLTRLARMEKWAQEHPWN